MEDRDRPRSGMAAAFLNLLSTPATLAGSLKRVRFIQWSGVENRVSRKGMIFCAWIREYYGREAKKSEDSAERRFTEEEIGRAEVHRSQLSGRSGFEESSHSGMWPSLLCILSFTLHSFVIAFR